MPENQDKTRCPWCGDIPLYVRYHDEEWGTPLHDDRALFELLILEGAQAGLSWLTVLNRREGYRQAYEGFVPERVAAFDAAKLAALATDSRIVRNRAKIAASVANAKAFLGIQAAFGSFDAYLWRFVDGRPVVGAWTDIGQVPAQTPLSQTVSRDLKARGFGFVGPTICQAFLQAAGLVNDHLTQCFRYRELTGGA
ncbi:MAG: DNA-3-methyladenine glycosylase I [Desulfovibrionaceae bacterium]